MSKDCENIEKISKFLNDNNISYTTSYPDGDNKQCVFTLKDVPVELRYVNSYEYKMDYSKRFGIKGVKHSYFIDISHENVKNGIRTIWIKDFEINECSDVKDVNGNIIKDYHRKWEVLKSYIKTAVGKIDNRLYARDCEVRLVPNKELRPFLELNCFYGYRPANKNLGLYLKKDKGPFKQGTLVYVYTFGSPFYNHNKPGQIEIIRVATLLNTQVIGAASKCIKYFLENYPVVKIGSRDVEVKSLLFYVDADHNSAKSMETLGFEFVSWKGNGFINVYADTGKTFQRKPLIHKQIMQMMAEGKVYSVANAGTIVYKLDKEQWLKKCISPSPLG